MSDQPISIIIVEDEPEFRRRFVQIIENEPSMKLVGVGANKREAQAIIDRESFDVMLIDLGLPDGSGIDLIRETARAHPQTDIMVISVFGDEGHVLASIEAGATGYILKDSLPEEFVGLIRQLRAGGSPISPVIARQLLKRFRPAAPEPAASGASPPAAAEAGLSPRETEVLSLIAKGFNFAEIARLLTVSPHTITAHVKKIYQKLAVHSRGEAVYEATRMGLL